MDPYLSQYLDRNTANFKRSLDRIADKYSKFKDEDDVLEVDIDKIELKTLSKYLSEFEHKLLKFGSKNQSYLKDRSLSAHSSTHSQLNWPCKDDGADDDSASSSEFPKEDSAEGTMSSLDGSWRNSSESEVLPEDQDEVLQMSLSSRCTSLAELYPTMVNRIERAWHRQTVSVAARSVLRRYHRWRQQPRRSLRNMLDITVTSADDQPKMTTSKRLFEEGSGSPAKRMWTETAPRPVLSPVTSLYNGQWSPGRERGLLSGETPRLISLMNFSDTAKPKEISLNKTFFVSELSPHKQTHLVEQIPIDSASPSQHPYTTAKSSVDPPFRFRRLSVSSHSAEVSTYAAETPSVPERPDIYSSPVRQSPFKARRMSNLSRSPLAFSRSPREYDGDCSREPMNPRSLSTSMSSPPKRPVVLCKMLYPQDCNQSSQLPPLSPLPAQAANSHRRFRRNLSLDSSLSSSAFHSPKKVDEDFMKLYHKFVCQNKSTIFNTLPCHLCGGSSEARRVLPSTSLAALALSPHRSILRKRHREQRCDRLPQSKRLRDQSCAHSPGSKRHRNEMLRRCLSQSEMEGTPSAVPYSPSKQRSQQSAAYLEAWMGRHQPQFSSLGGPLENKAFDGQSPRNWR
ncbi:hypothetical protein AMECASPLE_007551 [Ameca splendens]|uniref:Uncharacterized protein n=1 Tax=Ameca splendens TaxID=208324 RepID=A0ABV0ZWW2_9TELE